MSDCISRQAAIDALDALCDRECEYSKEQQSVMCDACHLGTAFDVLEQLQSAQPESSQSVVNASQSVVNDCISRQAAIDAINSHFGFNIEEEYGSAVQEVLNALPSAQPLIRCKDCYHYPSEYADCPMIGWARNENDFCSKAERKDDD